MKTYFLNILPKIQKYSKKLDNITLLTDQNWILFQENPEDKVVYIFRNNKQLLVSNNGIIKIGKWDFINTNSILIEISKESYLMKQQFFDEKIFIIKMDGNENYSIFLNESKNERELNSLEDISKFLSDNYLKNDKKMNSKKKSVINGETSRKIEKKEWKEFKTKNGLLKVEIFPRNKFPWAGDKVLLDNFPAPDGKYKLGPFNYIIVKNNKISKTTFV